MLLVVLSCSVVDVWRDVIIVLTVMRVVKCYFMSSM